MNNASIQKSVSRITRSRLPGIDRLRKRPFFLHMSPVTLSITSVLLIGLMAILYLNQVGQAVSANQQLQDIHNHQTQLQRENQDLVDTIAQEQSPAYIAQHAHDLGLVPADPKTIWIIVGHHLQPIPVQDQDLQP